MLGVRVKEAAIARGAVLVTVSARHNPIDDFAAQALRPHNGDAAATVQSVSRALLQDAALRARVADIAGVHLPAAADVPGTGPALAASALLAAPRERVAVIVAPSRHNAAVAGAQVRAAANLAIILAGPEAAPAVLHVLPPENNAVGLHDLGLVPGENGMGVQAMLAAARGGQLKALIVAKDNPLLTMPDRASVAEALTALDLLLVIDEVETDTARAATHLLPDVSIFGKDGTVTNADRQILRLHAGYAPQGRARPAWQHLQDLAQGLHTALNRDGEPPSFVTAASVMDAIAAQYPLYARARYPQLLRAGRQPANGAVTQAFTAPDVLSAESGGLHLLPLRDLYTDRTAAALRQAEADRLHRAEHLDIHPRDAAARNLQDGATVTVRRNDVAVTLTARVTDAVAEGSVVAPLLWEGGALQTLLPSDAIVPAVEVSPA